MKFSNLITIKPKFNRKMIIIFVLGIIAMLTMVKFDYYVKSDNDESSSIETNLTSSINDIINDINFGDVQSVVDSIESLDTFDINIKDRVASIINGKYYTDYNDIFSLILSLVFGNIREFLPIIFTIIGIGLLSNILINFKSNMNKSISNAVSLVCFSLQIIIILVSFKNILKTTSNTINSINDQIQIIFPILITLLASIGSMTTISIYNPLVAILTSIISFIFDKFLYPIFILIFLFNILGNLTDNVKLDKLSSFLNSLFKWTIGIVFTIFTGFLSIQGISAGKYDSVSIKVTKFAMKSYIPIIGTYVSQGMDFIVLGSVLVKNAIGIVGVMILFFTVISPIIKILIYKLGLQLSAGILEMTGDSKVGNFLNSCSKILILPIVLLIAISLMYVITICLVICTANIF